MQNFEQAHAAVGQGGDLRFCRGKGGALVSKLVAKNSQPCAKVFAGGGAGLVSLGHHPAKLCSLLGYEIAMCDQFFNLCYLRFAPLGERFIKAGETLSQYFSGLRFVGVERCLTLFERFGELAAPLGQFGVERGDFSAKLRCPRRSRFISAALNRVEFGQPFGDLRVQPCNGGFKPFVRAVGSIAHRCGKRFGGGRCLVRPFPQRRKCLTFKGDKPRLVSLNFGLQSAEALGHHSLDPGKLAFEAAKRVVDAATELCDLCFGGFAGVSKPFEPADQPYQLIFCHPACTADLIGDIARGIGDNRQIVTQPVHVAERGFAGGADRIHLGAIAENQGLQFARMGRQSFRRDPAQRLKIARLGGEKFACQAEFAVHHLEPRFKRRAFTVHQCRTGSKAVRLGAR